MSNRKLAIIAGLIGATTPLMAQTPSSSEMTGAPAAGPSAKYCMRVAPATGSQIELVRCWTRAQWSEQGVDVDKEWAAEGVSVREDGMDRP